MILGNLDEGLRQTNHESIRLPVRPFMVIAKHGLEALRLDKIGKRFDVLDRDAALDQYGRREAQVFALLVESTGSQRTSRRARLLIEQVGFAAHCQIGFGITLEAFAQITPLETFWRSLEGESGQLCFGPKQPANKHADRSRSSRLEPNWLNFVLSLKR